jgi:hypothetical protein
MREPISQSGKKRQIKFTDRFQRYVPLLCGLLTSTIVLILMNRDYPNVGHDYRYFILRIIDTKLFLLLNGPAIQWYSPSFGGGLPAYPNPQYIQYSIVQFFTLLMDPWQAVLVSTFVITSVGFVAFEQFLEKVMSFHWTSSTLGAVFLIGNGFFIEHMIVGHIGHQLFPLGAVLLSAIVDNRQTLIKSGAILALILGMMIHQTGFYIIIIFGLSFVIVLPLIRLYNPEILNSGLVLRKLALGLVLAGLIAGSRIHAVMSLMQLFPRVVSDSYPVGIFQALTGLMAQLLGAMFLTPFLLLARQDISLLSGSLANITGAHYGIWETDIGLSPVLIVLLFYGLARLIRGAREKRPGGDKASPHIITWLVLLAGIWITTELTLARGIIYPYIKTLPVLRSMHVNVRFAAGFILPLTLAGIMEYEHLSRGKLREILFPITAGLALVFMVTYNLFPSDVHSRHYDLTRTFQTDAAIQRGERFPIDHVAAIEEETVFIERATNLLYYEPLFSDYDRTRGYILKDLAIQVRPGAITEIDDGYYNMTNPASLVFPMQNDLQPFERIKIGEEEQLRAFTERRQPKWKIPKIQIILDWVSLSAFVLTIGMIILTKGLERVYRSLNRVNRTISPTNF